jgi:hypothetical protein
MAVGISLHCSEMDPEEIHLLSQSLLTSLSDAGILVQRAQVAAVSNAGREYKGDPISLGSLLISIAGKASITAVVSSLKALFASAPKSLTATVTNGERTFSFTAGNLGPDELNQLVAILQRQA